MHGFIFTAMHFVTAVTIRLITHIIVKIMVIIIINAAKLFTKVLASHLSLLGGQRIIKIQ